MKNKKIVLVVIIVLLCFFLPASIYGAIVKVPKKSDNLEKKFNFQGKLWFYDKNDKLICKYTCLTKECGIAKGIIDDEEYGIHYYKDGKELLDYNNSSFTFITDGDKQMLYAVKADSTKPLTEYKNIKYYGTKLESGYVIVQNENDKWGVLSIKDVLASHIPFEYDFIGLKNEFNEKGELITNKFIVKKEDGWYVVDDSGSVITSKFENPIVDFNDYYVAIKEGDQYKVFDYENNPAFTNYKINKVVGVRSYLAILTDTNMYVYAAKDYDYVSSVDINNIDDSTTIRMNEEKLEIVVNNEVVNIIN